MNEKSKELQNKLLGIKTDIEGENRVYIDRCREVQNMLSHLDMSDNRVLQKMSSAISKSNDANSSYYAYLIIKLKEVDRITKAYEIAELDYQVVEQVYQLIQYINDESSIKNSFDGAINYGFSSIDIGTMAVVSYSPSIEAKALELSWKEKLDKMPAQKRQEYDKQKKKELDVKTEYRKELDAWKKACMPITKQREEYVNNVITEKTRQIQKELTLKYETEKKAKEDQVQVIKNNIDIKNNTLKQLGLFRYKEKQAIRGEIQKEQNKIEDIKQSLTQLKLQYNEAQVTSVKQAKDSIEKEAKLEAESKYPYLPEPKKPESVIKEEQIENARISKLLSEIIEALIETDTFMTRADLESYFMGQKDRWDMRKAIERGVRDNLIYHSKIKGVDYYARM